MQAARRVANALPRLGEGLKQQSRNMSSHGSPEENVKWMKTWTYVTYAAVPVVAAFGFYTMQHSHDHHEQPDYPYLKKRDRKFPWGSDCDLFDFHCGKH